MPLLCRPLLTKDSKPRAVASSYLCQTQLAISCGKRLSKLQLESRLEGVFFFFSIFPYSRAGLSYLAASRRLSHFSNSAFLERARSWVENSGT